MEIKGYMADSIEKAVIEGLNQVASVGYKRGWDNKSLWTEGIIKKLSSIAKEKGFKVCAKQTDAPKADYGEWVKLDMAWIEYEDTYLIDTHLVLECQWNENEVYKDIEKLMEVRAHNRVLIFQKKTANDAIKIIDVLKKQIVNFKGSKPEDRYLFAVWTWDPTAKWEYEIFLPFRHLVEVPQ